MSKIHLSEQHIKKITIKANHNRANTFIVNVAYFILYKYKSFRRPCKRAFLNNYTKKTGTICYLLLFHCCRSLHVFIILYESLETNVCSDHLSDKMPLAFMGQAKFSSQQKEQI